MSLVSRLRQARLEARLTQQGAAEQADIERNTLWRYEAGQREPSASTLRVLANIYGKPVDWFWEDDEELVEILDAELVDDIDIADPELALFFRGEWDDLTDEEKEFIKGMIRESRELLRKRRESGA